MKRVLITGGSGGIGQAAVRKFTELGMDVSFSYYHGAEKALRLQKETGATAIFLNVADGRQVAETLGEQIAQWGGFDILINNAGIAGFSLLTELSDEKWEEMLAVNLSGAFYCCKAVLPSMISRKWGRILNVSSMWGIVGSACEVHYSAAKAGLIGFTKALAAEEAPSGITVNCIAPGVIDTPMNASLGEETIGSLVEQTPLGRLGRPEEVAELMAYLASEQAAFLTGQVICQSGGFVR